METTSYAWYTEDGQKGSSTQNISGVYDLSGCVWEFVATYINNTHVTADGTSSAVENRNRYGGMMISETDLKYKTIIPHDSSESKSNQKNWQVYKNMESATYGYGDAILETSTSGSTSSGSWLDDYASYPYSTAVFLLRGGGNYIQKSGAGIFAYSNWQGHASDSFGFRPVLFSK